MSKLPHRAQPLLRRREFLRAGLATAATAALPGWTRAATAIAPMRDNDLLDDVTARMVRFFWATSRARTGLAPDRFPTAAPASVAAIGFALTAYPIGVERGLISRAAARDRVLTTLRFLHEAPQGEAPQGTAGYKGFFYHFLDMETGTRSGACELSTVDTALLMAGVLFCQSYFDRADAAEAEIRLRADALYARIDWTWAQPRAPAIVHGWTPEHGFLPWDWRGYCEAMLVYLLALGAPLHAVAPAAWDAWTGTYGQSWGTYWGETHLAFASLFGHFYTQAWVDFRGIRDAWMAARDLDYFENSRRAVLAQRNYAIANPQGWRDYGTEVWGVSACDGPVDAELHFEGHARTFRRYYARGAAGPYPFDDGTLNPPVVLASLAVAPEVALPAAQAQYRRYGRHIYAQYGFLDAFNPSFRFDTRVSAGRLVPGLGWVDSDYVGIDQGIALAMTENHRSGLVWQVMRGNAHVRRGLRRAGFHGGWLA